MQGARTNDPRRTGETRPNRDAHEFERDRGRESEVQMHDPRTGEAIPQRYLDDDVRDHDRPSDRRELDTRFTGRGYHYPGGAYYADESGRRDARVHAHFEEHRSYDPGGRDDLWRRGEYGGRMYGNVVGAATPSGTAGIARYGRGGAERKGPKGYVRSDERLRDDICERLSDEAWIDLSQVDVHVDDGRVRLEGEVPDRFSKFAIEDIADGAWGVKEVDNHLRVRVQ